MAARRIKSDRFFTDDFTPEVYTPAGFAWVADNGMRDGAAPACAGARARAWPTSATCSSPGPDRRADLARRIRVPGLVDIVRVDEPEEIRALDETRGRPEFRRHADRWSTG